MKSQCIALGIIAQLLGTYAGDSFTMLPASCTTLEDGLHYIQPLGTVMYQSLGGDSTANAPPIRVYCSNGYTIVDPSLDSNVIKYFSSFHDYHTTFAGPDLDDNVNWRVWWLPTRMDFSATFMVSEDCQTIDVRNSNIQVYDDQTVYYMTGDAYGCNWPTKAMCDFDADTLECYTCSVNSDTSVKIHQDGDSLIEDEVYYGKCGHMPYPASSVPPDDHSSCTEDTGSYLPSIGTIGRYCVGYKGSGTSASYLMADESLIDYGLEEAEKELEAEMYEDALLTIELTQDDFMDGTYRITKPGTYIITEDIAFDFNAGQLRDPNIEDSWFPLASQCDDYPGAGEWDGHYWLGFFAGITIEASNVILDLNGHEIGMSPGFYYQQRFFSCIELNNKIFLDGEGPTWTGTDITFAENVIIKDGTVGLTSHIGIHGNKVTDLTIENVHVQSFETHGIGINEFYNLKLTNVEIGPSIDGQLGLNGNYNLARYTLPIFRSAAQESGIASMKFQDRADTTFQAVVNRLVSHMNMAFKYAYFGEQTESDEWDVAKRTFVNDWGISRAGTIYGAVLRSRGASVFNYGKDTGSGYSDGLTINGLHIHDIKLNMEEIIALGISTNSWIRDVFNAPLNLEEWVSNKFVNGKGEVDIDSAKYLGNAYTDSVIALKHLSTSWWYLGRLAMVEPFVTWARELNHEKPEDEDYLDLETLGDIDHEMYLHCNYDSLGHVPKGAIGLRMELSKNIEINDLIIEDLYSFTPLGSDKCGKYVGGTDGGMPLQATTTNAGFGGTQSRGFNIYAVEDMTVNNMEIKNIVSLNGPAYGVHGQTGKGTSNNVKFTNSKFEGIYGGIELSMNNVDYSTNHWPNVAASACAVELNEGITFDKDTTTASCIYGHVGCTACTQNGLCSTDGTYSNTCQNTLTLKGKDLQYTIDTNGETTTDTTINSYIDVVTRLGAKALTARSNSAATTARKGEIKYEKSDSDTDTQSDSNINSDAKTQSLNINSDTIVDTDKSVKMGRLKPMSLKHSTNTQKSNNKGGMSGVSQFFVYGSILLILFGLVVVTKFGLIPKYRARRAGYKTFEDKVSLGKNKFRENAYKRMANGSAKLTDEELEELIQGKNITKSDEYVRLINNAVNGDSDTEYSQL